MTQHSYKLGLVYGSQTGDQKDNLVISTGPCREVICYVKASNLEEAMEKALALSFNAEPDIYKLYSIKEGEIQ